MVTDVHALARDAKRAARAIASASDARRSAVLLALADALEREAAALLEANRVDVEGARDHGVEGYFIDRLTLTPARLAAIAADTRTVARLPDPLAEPFDQRVLPNGLRIHRQPVPLGVLGVIYEARPNVTVDIAALAIKSGNACVLRGGSETLNSNRALVKQVKAALVGQGLPAEAVGFIDDPARERILDLLRAHESIELIIPRGGAKLHTFCREHSTITVITGGMGINHLYLDATADFDRALDIIDNAKTQRPTVCNALGTLLVQRAAAAGFLPRVAAHLAARGVTFRCDPESLAHVPADLRDRASEAQPGDYDTEWLSLVLGIKVVADVEEAIAFIHAHSLEHSDGILSRDAAVIARFVREIDSSAVFVNASTRFNDGGQLGLGAEVAVSTQRIHARGPMGLGELTSYKWVVQGDGHVRG
ncbi:MAG: glutamate-5-semialdehyde dehydrogenase [Thermoflexales bacterium]|nr:glutamate-5-semialdehyde dehydrogenase [Thermoflexales bacterium]